MSQIRKNLCEVSMYIMWKLSILDSFILICFMINGYSKNHIFSIKGTFVWKSGAPFTYTSWRAREPNSGSLSGCYAVHTFVGDFSWNDAKCSYTTWPRNWAGKKWRPLCKKEKPGSTGTVVCIIV